MQNILNKKDRTDAFFKFLFFFLVTVALVVAAAYFNFKVPEKHYEFLKTQALVVEQRNHFQKDFIEQTNKVYYSMDTLAGQPATFDQIVSDVKLNLNSLYNRIKTSQIEAATSSDDENNALLLNALFKLKELYELNHKLKQDIEKLKDVEDELKNCKKDLAEYKRTEAAEPTQ